MPKLKKFLKAIDHRVSTGATFQWACFGPNARILDTTTEYGEAGCVYDTNSQFLYEVTVHDSLGRHEAFRWVHKDYRDAVKDEAKSRKIDYKEFLDGQRWSDTDSLDDILDKVYGILNNRSFDHNVVMEFDLDNETLATIQKAAKLRNITMDAFIQEALQAVIDESKFEPTVDNANDSAKVVGKKSKSKKK